MELFRLLTAFDYTLILLLAVIFVFSVMEGGHKSIRPGPEGHGIYCRGQTPRRYVRLIS